MVGNRRQESEEHLLIKHLVAAIAERGGGSPEIEADFGDSIIDVFLRKTGMAVEVQSVVNKKVEDLKVQKYLLHGEIRDVMFIYTKDFRVDHIINSSTYKSLKFKLGV